MDDQILDPNIRSELPNGTFQPQKSSGSWKIWIAGVLALILVAAAAWYMMWGKSPAANPTSSKVTMSINGSDSVPSGAEAAFRINYRNDENADMTNVHLDLIYPSNFQFKSSTPAAKSSSGQSFELPMLKQGKDGLVEIRGKLSGATGEDKQFLAKLHYTLSNFNSNFEVDQTFHVVIQAPSLTFEITGPVEVPVGQDTTFRVNYTNVSNQDYDNLAFSLVYPAGFNFSSASVPASKNNNYWQIGKLAMNANGHVDITGSFIGQNLDEQLITGQLGLIINNTFAPQISSTATFKLKNAPIAISQTVTPSNIVNLGDSLQFTVKYGNQSSIGLTNLIITDTLSSTLIDTSKLSASDAIITGSTITWKAATNGNLSILSPGEQGQLNFTVPLKTTLTTTQKNQVIKSILTVTSAEVTNPIRATDLEIKLASKLTLDIVGDYISGPSPMKVGSSTLFSITFLLSNTTNDLTDAAVIASLPLPPAAWKNVIVPDAEKSFLSYDPSSGKIRWQVGNIPAFTGKITPARKVTFQLSVTPDVSDQGSVMKLLSDVRTTASDAFTNQQISLTPVYQYSTSDLDDPQFDNPNVQ